MIWVIGDIHGMFDPMKRLLSAIHAVSAQKNSKMPIEKIIFLGDYIDYGPSSKEVVDYIMQLPFETVCLMGNHDDLMLQFLERSELFKRFGNVWFRGNGGQQTVSSFFPQTGYGDSDEKLRRDDFMLDERYLNFFKNLAIAHVETIAGVKFAFVHAMLNTQFPVQEQLDLKRYDDFHKWLSEKDLWIEDAPLWSRKEPLEKYGDLILVHGHTPTTKIAQAWKRLHGYRPDSGLPFFKFVETPDDSIELYENNHRMTYSASLDRLISIDVDTGAVYGDRLTAIGLSAELLQKNQFLVYQVLVGQGYRLTNDFHIRYVELDV